jgi:WD40 repeat protein
MQITANRKCLFTLDQNGSLLQWEITSDTLIHNWTKLNNGIGIKKFGLGKESTYMFSADSQNRLKQWSIVKKRLHHDFG